MNDSSLHDLLEKLHKEMEQTERLDEDSLELLRRLEEDIQAVLKHAGEQPHPAAGTLAERLQESIAEFEAAHPTLTLALSNILSTLSNAGI